MTRRALFSMLALAAVDPERLVWVPGRKHISIPVPQPVVPATIVLTMHPGAYCRWLRDVFVEDTALKRLSEGRSCGCSILWSRIG